MANTEESRIKLYRKLEQVLGQEEASVLMDYLRRFGEDGATKDDVGLLKGDVDLMRHDIGLLRHDVDGLRHDVDGLRHDVDGLRQDVDGLRQDVDGLRHEMQLFETRIDAKLERELRVQSGRFIVWTATFLGLFLTTQTYLLGVVLR